MISYQRLVAGVSLGWTLERACSGCLGCRRVRTFDLTSHSLSEPHVFALRSVYVFTVAYGLSLGPVAWVLPSEIFPLSMRGRGVALSTASVWLNNCAPFHMPCWHVSHTLNEYYCSLHRPSHTRTVGSDSRVSVICFFK